MKFDRAIRMKLNIQFHIFHLAKVACTRVNKTLEKFVKCSSKFWFINDVVYLNICT